METNYYQPTTARTFNLSIWGDADRVRHRNRRTILRQRLPRRRHRLRHGVDAVVGAFDRIAFTGVGGQKLHDKCKDGPLIYLGVESAGFPNLLMLAGLQAGFGFTDFEHGIEEAVDWTSALLRYLRDHDYTRIDTTEEAEQAWRDHVIATYDLLLLGKVKSRFTGFNSNMEGRDTMRPVAYNRGAQRYRRRLAEVAERDYEGFVLS